MFSTEPQACDLTAPSAALPLNVAWPVLLQCKRLLEPPYLDSLKRTRALPIRSSSSSPQGVTSNPVSLSAVIEMSGRLCSTTRAPSDYLPTPALLPLDTDKETLLSNAVAQNVTAPLALSCLHPCYHPPFPLPEEIQQSQLFKLHRFVEKTGLAGAAARAALSAEKKPGGGHCVGPRPPLPELWRGAQPIAPTVTQTSPGLPLRRPDFLVDWLSADKNEIDQPLEVTEPDKRPPKVWLREELQHGRKKIRILWEESSGGGGLPPEGMGGIIMLNPPRMELVKVDGEEEIVLTSNHGGGAVVVYSLYDSEHLTCCGKQDGLEGDESSSMHEDSWGGMEELYSRVPSMMSSRGWFLYDDVHRPRVDLSRSSALSMCAYVHMPAAGWADSPFLTEVIRKPTTKEGGAEPTPDDTGAKTKWSYSLFMETGRDNDEEAESEPSENGSAEQDSRGDHEEAHDA
eukprot:GHVS01033439.1.p1 GENE.GHVS01033439.1~~GHVS01033439.1.p1  ORF type:complete len:457 (+),score=105.37 GHVS01033439.1:143-1513(+)